MNYKAIIKKQSTVIAIAVICLTIATIGVSFALFFQVETNSNNQIVTAGTLNVSYGSGSSSISATELVPTSDDEALTSSTMTGTIYIENKGTLPANYEIALGNDTKAITSAGISEEELLSHEYIRVAAYVNGELLIEPTTLNKLATSENSTDLYKLFDGTIETTGTGNSTLTVVIKVWVSENAPESIIGDYVYLKMDITSEVSEENLKSKIIAHASKNNYLYNTAPAYDSVNADGEFGLYSTIDDQGITYYFRGDVENNYVKFGTYAKTYPSVYYGGCNENGVNCYYVQSYSSLEACEADWDGTGAYCSNEIKYGTENKPMYWRIIRINGDGSIRLIYAGSELQQNSDVNTSAFMLKDTSTANTNVIYNNNCYEAADVRYVYSNGTDSNIKKELESWYKDNLLENYDEYIADAIFCNDTNEKIIDTDVYYGAYNRVYSALTPTLRCSKASDRYSKSASIGNGLLDKPVGMITADEAIFAGMSTKTSNPNNYLHADSMYWTMSPSDYLSGLALAFTVNDTLTGSSQENFVCSDDTGTPIGARPVINLKGDLEFIGDGTIKSPYEIKELAE